MKESKPPTARLEARLPPHVHAMLKCAAEIEGRTLTDFVIAASSEAGVANHRGHRHHQPFRG